MDFFRVRNPVGGFISILIKLILPGPGFEPVTSSKYMPLGLQVGDALAFSAIQPKLVVAVELIHSALRTGWTSWLISHNFTETSGLILSVIFKPLILHLQGQ